MANDKWEMINGKSAFCLAPPHPSGFLPDCASYTAPVRKKRNPLRSPLRSGSLWRSPTYVITGATDLRLFEILDFTFQISAGEAESEI
jgi:hypothetical protein